MTEQPGGVTPFNWLGWSWLRLEDDAAISFLAAALLEIRIAILVAAANQLALPVAERYGKYIQSTYGLRPLHMRSQDPDGLQQRLRRRF